MSRRLIVAIGLACVLALTLAAQARAATTTLTLVGTRTVVLQRWQVPARVSWDGTAEGNINQTLRYVYWGQTLYKLVGKVDDGDPSTFNRAKAERGYKIRFIALDGVRHTISSWRIIGKVHWIIAKRKGDALLPEGEGPYRFVGSFVEPYNCHESIYQLVKIRLIF